MNMVNVPTCAGMVTGFLLILRSTPTEFADGIFRCSPELPDSIESEVQKMQEKKRLSILQREVELCQEVLALTGKGDRTSPICATALGLFMVGGILTVMLGNVFLISVPATGFSLLLFWYIRLTEHHHKKVVASELETVLNIIIIACLRNEDILTIVSGNIHYLNPSVGSVF